MIILGCYVRLCYAMLCCKNKHEYLCYDVVQSSSEEALFQNVNLFPNPQVWDWVWGSGFENKKSEFRFHAMRSQIDII